MTNYSMLWGAGIWGSPTEITASFKPNTRRVIIPRLYTRHQACHQTHTQDQTLYPRPEISDWIQPNTRLVTSPRLETRPLTLDQRYRTELNPTPDKSPDPDTRPRPDGRWPAVLSLSPWGPMTELYRAGDGTRDQTPRVIAREVQPRWDVAPSRPLGTPRLTPPQSAEQRNFQTNMKSQLLEFQGISLDWYNFSVSGKS